MTRVVQHPPNKKLPRHAPERTIWLRRALSDVHRSVRYHRHTLVSGREARRGITRPKSWRRWPLWPLIVRILSGLAAVAVLAWVAESAYSLSEGHGYLTAFERWRKDNSAAVDTILRFLVPLLTAGVLTVVFLIGWSRTRQRFVDRARSNPRELVLTAGPNIAEVVGRQELAQVIAQILRDPKTRRPCLLVGGVGVGKTAVLVKLTQMLAEQDAVPVPIRLRDAADRSDLNFEEMAMRRFLDETDQGIFIGGNTERVWRQLRARDQAVVIADGLEEAILGDEWRDDRDNIIRRAIDRAYKDRLPLVIASRPHAPLEGTRAAIIDLEPLSEEAALDFVEENSPEVDERRLDWIVETAEVTESPIYLQIARELHRHDVLERDRPRHDPGRLDTRSWDRSTLRLWLLETWYNALVDGRLRSRVAMESQHRRDTLEIMSALACVGLLQDRLEVKFEDFLGEDVHRGLPQRAWARIDHSSTKARSHNRQGKNRKPLTDWHREQIWQTLCTQLSIEESRLLLQGNDLQCYGALARFAGNAQELQLVEGFEKKVRFPHSIIQAYLGFRMLDQLGEHTAGELVEQALLPPGPGRELLIALVLFSRRQAACADAERGKVKADILRGAKDLRRRVPLTGPTLAERLCTVANRRTDPKALDLYAAALEMESMESRPRLLGDIARKLGRGWSHFKGDGRTLDEAKLGLVRQFGAALRTASEKIDLTDAYEQFFTMAQKEPQYAIRLAIAQEMGDGGDPVFALLRSRFSLHHDPVTEYHERIRALKEKRDRALQMWEAKVDHAKHGPLPGVSMNGAGPSLELERIHRRYHDSREALWREFVMRAWLVPMLVGSVSDDFRYGAESRLRKWLRHLGPQNTGGKADLPISLENALAQGFKHAANRRKRHPHTCDGARCSLVRHAESMLQRTRYWYAQVSLLHALCLWELPDTVSREGAGQARANSQHGTGHDGTDPVQTVERWLSMASSALDSAAPSDPDHAAPHQVLHPFVAETADMVTLALETGRPEQFIWIDEKGVIDSIGSRLSGPQHYRKHNLWIPPSVGWSTLHTRAQRLVGDVLVLLNLTEHDGRPDEVEERLEAAIEPGMPSLPPCLTDDRTPLHPETSVGTFNALAPGSTCLSSCKFQLCPYPARSGQPRAEIREPFCRQQQSLLPRGWRRVGADLVLRRKTPTWVGIPANELYRFWDAMAGRTRASGGERKPTD